MAEPARYGLAVLGWRDRPAMPVRYELAALSSPGGPTTTNSSRSGRSCRATDWHIHRLTHRRPDCEGGTPVSRRLARQNMGGRRT